MTSPNSTTLTPIEIAKERPEWFDAKLLAYLPTIRKLAKRFSPRDHEELAQDAAMFFLRNWKSYRADGGFYLWIRTNVRSLAQQKRQFNDRRANIQCHDADGAIAATHGTPASQENYAIVSDIFDRASRSRAGRVVVRRALGDSLEEIGADIGLCRERVRQLHAEGVGNLRAA